MGTIIGLIWADTSNLAGSIAVATNIIGVLGIVVTDTVPIDPLQKPENLSVLTVSGLLAETIMNVFADESVSAIFGGENQLF